MTTKPSPATAGDGIRRDDDTRFDGASPSMPGHRDNRRTVSSPHERLILVDAHDRVLGAADKLECHLGDGRLHRAFSLHVVNARGEILLQRRAHEKFLWPGFWSNSCCSHPRSGETIEAAVHRRAAEELGLQIEARYLYKFRYHARYRDVGSERELCSVFVAFSDTRPDPNPSEVSDWRYLRPEALDAALERDSALYTPWFKLEWRRLRHDYPELFQRR